MIRLELELSNNQALAAIRPALEAKAEELADQAERNRGIERAA